MNRFDGVNEQGVLSYWEEIDLLDLGEIGSDRLEFPLIINFRSNREHHSPSLGRGWLFPLFESNLVQVDENRFLIVEPDGENRWFWRDNAKGNVLEGQGGWKAEIKSNTISAWASCGWRLDFVNGKLQSITTSKGRRLDYVWEEGFAVSIRENGVTKISLEKERGSNRWNRLTYNGKRLSIELAQIPVVQVVNDQNVVARMEDSLSRIGDDSQPRPSYAFAVNEKIEPTMIVKKADSDRAFVWNPGNKRIISDRDWRYTITPGESESEHAAIGRTNASGLSEYWKFDGSRGFKTYQGTDGIRKTQHWYTSGPLSGKVRLITDEINGVVKTRYQVSYDQNGDIIRELSDTSEIVYEIPNRPSAIKQGGKVVCRFIYNQDGSLKELQRE